ncbi:hypothetical protein [Sandaracinus amylolyticus]|uniref:hypothetical protein n=1 Tax=Sandaracinus amylolyticus TaxID=927083 RepID=UPI001F33D241|nr:hypothetical protein [Sandaracinus amylolyticus]UJR85937.1 Hypothetical protein I5071_80170 [Sandaracinus amylolyticus]
MISFPALFFALSSVALIAALAAIWSSLRVAFGGGRALVIDTARDLPDHAALVEEKNALLRAIKDLEYEHAVGKTSDADYQRLDAAYRARAKQVLVQLDRDVKPLYEQAETLIAQHVGNPATATRPTTKAKKAARNIEASAAEPPREPTVDEKIEAVRGGEIVGVEDVLEGLSDEKREKVAAFLKQAVENQLRAQGDEGSPTEKKTETTERDE